MATIKAFIRTSKANKSTPVNVRFRLSDGRTGFDKETGKAFNGIQLFHKSEITVLPERWDERQQKIKTRVVMDEEERRFFDKAVNDRKNIIMDIYSKNGKSLTSEILDDEIVNRLNPVIAQDPNVNSFFRFVDKFIEESPNRKDKTTGRPLTEKSIKQYPTTAKMLKDFAKSQGKTDFGFIEFNQQFYDDFVEFLQNKSYSQNYIGKHIKVLKVFLNEAKRQGLNAFNHFSSFHVFMDDVDSVYLNETELQLILDTDFSNTPHLDHVRDLFLLLSWTGCRFSDLGKVVKADIKDGFFSFRQQKTGSKVVVPVHPIVKVIFEKYNFVLPDIISNMRFNEYLKIVCMIAGINSKVSTTRTTGGKAISESFEKWQLVSSHTGRRCFATNMYKRGLPSLSIMAITGHKTEKSFLKYIKVQQEEHAEIMKKAWENMYK